jgi:hypothetical protein
VEFRDLAGLVGAIAAALAMIVTEEEIAARR